MLRQAYAANLVVTAIAYAVVWAYAPSLPQIANSFEQGIHAYVQDNIILGPLFYRATVLSGQ
jgi:hypothetical protein